MFFFHHHSTCLCFDLCVPVRQGVSFLLCSTTPRWPSLGNSSHFMPGRKSDPTPTHAYILISVCIEFLFIPFLCYFFLPAVCPSGAGSLFFLSVMVMAHVCFDARTHLLVPPKLFSANGNLQYCMLKPSGCCWWPVVGGCIWELLSWNKGKKACFDVNKGKPVEKIKLLQFKDDHRTMFQINGRFNTKKSFSKIFSFELLRAFTHVQQGCLTCLDEFNVWLNVCIEYALICLLKQSKCCHGHIGFITTEQSPL